MIEGLKNEIFESFSFQHFILEEIPVYYLIVRKRYVRNIISVVKQ